MTIGTGLPRRDAPAKAAGTFPFLTDRTFPGCLWAAVVRSPYPHAEVVSVDTAELAARPGAVAAFAAADLPRCAFNPATVPADPELAPTADKHMLTDVARHVGDGVAVVVARTREAARCAAADAPVVWRPLPAFLTLDDALAADLVLGHVRFGDERTAEVLAAADLVVQDRYEFAAAQHVCLEPHACAAVPDSTTGGVEVWTNAQCPAEIRRLVSMVLDLHVDLIRVRKVDEGGGFGAKQDMFEEALLAWLARRMGHPIRLTYSRSEEFTAGRVRGAGRIDLRLGFDRAGLLLGGEMDAVLDSGAYASHTPYVLSCVGGHLPSAYPRASFRFHGIAVRTHTIPAGAYRGYGVAEANFAIEQALDRAARILRMDPIELRLRNMTDRPDGRGIAACLRLVQGHPVAKPSAQDGRARGSGVAIAIKHSVTSATDPDVSTAVVRMSPGPAVTLLTGTCDSGTGSSTALAQIVADELSVPVEIVTVEEGDTANGIVDLGSTSQRSIFVGGQAARRAAAGLRRLLLDCAADVTGIAAEDLTIRWPYVVHRHGEAILISLSRLIDQQPPDTLSVRTQTQASGFGASSCALRVSVAVDVETGKVSVEDALMAIDCGAVVNELAARGQVIGGIVQGVGLACIDQSIPGPQGRGPEGIYDHGVPGAGDAPTVTVLFHRDRSAPVTAPPSGLGELPIVPVAAAVANAVAAATGRRCRRAPLRPAEVWRQLHGGEAGPV